MTQLKGPVIHWCYVNRFGGEREFGGGLSADLHRHATIVLSDRQSVGLLEQQLAASLADELTAGSGDALQLPLDAGQYLHVEATAAFVLRHGVEPLDVQRHIAAVSVETRGAGLSDTRFMALMESSRASGQWPELMKWRTCSDSLNKDRR